MDVDWANGIPLMAGPFQIGHAEPSPETVGFWDGIREGRLLIKKCETCGRHQHPRRLFCTNCRGDAFAWVEVAGSGTIYTFSTVHRAPYPEFTGELPYTVGVLELVEGVFFFSRILPREGEPIRIGLDVRLTFQQTGPHGRLPAFQVAG